VKERTRNCTSKRDCLTLTSLNAHSSSIPRISPYALAMGPNDPHRRTFESVRKPQTTKSMQWFAPWCSADIEQISPAQCAFMTSQASRISRYAPMLQFSFIYTGNYQLLDECTHQYASSPILKNSVSFQSHAAIPTLES